MAAVEKGTVEKHQKRDGEIKRREDDSTQPWLKLLVRIFQLVCFGIAIGGTLGSIVAIAQGRKNGAAVVVVIALYALIMAILAEWIMRYIKRSLP